MAFFRSELIASICIEYITQNKYLIILIHICALPEFEHEMKPDKIK